MQAQGPIRYPSCQVLLVRGWHYGPDHVQLEDASLNFLSLPRNPGSFSPTPSVAHSDPSCTTPFPCWLVIAVDVGVSVVFPGKLGGVGVVDFLVFPGGRRQLPWNADVPHGSNVPEEGRGGDAAFVKEGVGRRGSVWRRPLVVDGGR